MQLLMPRGFVLMALLSALAAPIAQAAPQADQGHTQAHASQAPAAVPDHSVSGVVKLVDRNRLVITRTGKTPVEMTFSVNASTQREGTIEVGTKVQVRFRGDGHDGHAAVATAILAAPAAHHAK
jgi:hypothetical protein